MAVLAGMAFILLLQSFFFVYVISAKPDIESADLIVAFEGRRGRASEAYSLADQSYAPVLVISPATHQTLEVYDRRFQPKHQFDRIIEKNAQTTFENALYSGRIVKKHHFKTIILVTSWNHMPRSYLLFKMVLFGTKTRIQPYCVATGKLNRENWYRYPVGWKMVYNEMLESWGSMIELVKYRFSGDLAHTRIGKNGFVKALRNVLLFEIDPVATKPYSS